MFNKILGIVMKSRRPVVFKWEDGVYGSVHVGAGNPISINLKMHSNALPTKTYLHENLHCIFPTMSERDIRKLENDMWRWMTSKQRFLLSKKLYNRRWRTM